jgi:hypothetical protein
LDLAPVDERRRRPNGARDPSTPDSRRRGFLTLLAWYWAMVAAHPDAVTWLGVTLTIAGFYLRSRAP